MDAKQVWRAALGELQVSLSPANFETWLKDTVLVAVEDDHFRIAVPNGFAKDWLENRYRSLISQTLARVVGYSVNVEFEVRERRRLRGRGPSRRRRGRGGPDERHPGSALEPGRVGGPRAAAVSLNPRYTFRTFIVGSANRLAHAASLSVAERPGHAYNPLFLYGGVGLGKTHLMHAIGNAVVARFPRKRVMYVTSEKFTNEFITSIQQGRIDDFRNALPPHRPAAHRRHPVHRGQGAHAGGVLPHLQRDPRRGQADRALVRPAAEADRRPSRSACAAASSGASSRTSPRRTSRRASPSCAPRRRSRASRVDPEALEFIARKVVSNIRELEGALNRIVAYASMQGMPITSTSPRPCSATCSTTRASAP